MAGVLDSIYGVIDQILSSIWAAAPLLLGLLVLIFAIFIYWLYSNKRGPFYWWGAISAPVVIVQEGKQNVGLPKGDRFRRTQENGVELLESQTFREKFPGACLLQYIVYKRGGTKEYAEFLPLGRKGTKMWGSWKFAWFEKNGEDGKALLNPDDVVKSNEGIPFMVQTTEQFFSKSLLAQIAPYATFALAVIGLIVVTLILTQFLTAMLTQHIQVLTASTDANIRLTNAIMNMTSGGKLVTPPA